MTKKILISVHLAYWFYMLVITQLLNDLAYKSRWPRLAGYVDVLFISNVFLFTAVFYVNYFIVLPRFFKKKKFLQMILYWILLALAYVAIRFWIQEYLFMKYFGICNYCYSNYADDWAIYAVNNFFQALSNLIMAGTIIWFVNDWLKLEKQKVQLQKEKGDAERAFLQSQISPHFLFNSLNNIYSMVYHGSADSLPAIQKLSGLMRYITAGSHSFWTDLSVELEYLDDYIRLQLYRIKDAAIDFSVTGDTSGKVIAPLILISFVENAFKHGIVTDYACPVIIRVEIKENSLSFFTRNKILVQENKDGASGIGLRNVESRLSIQYPGMHSLDVQKKDGIFEVRLLIETLKAHEL